MSHPYVIWTMRRTGGTTLASLLVALSEHAGTQHEPFNSDRKFGYVPAAFARTGDAEQLRKDLQACLVNRPLIKHCYDLMHPSFDAVFLEVTTALGYRHIVLDRRSETNRIVSLELARLTGVWGSAEAQKTYPAIEAGDILLKPINTARVLEEMRFCNTRRQELAAMLSNMDLAPFVVYFEDVYSDPQAGRLLIARLLAFLELHPENCKDYDVLVNDALLKRGQNSARILQMVPDVQAAVAKLEAEHAAQVPVFAAS